MTKISVIIPFKKLNEYFIKKTVSALEKQTFKDFELVIIPDDKIKVNFSGSLKIISSGKIGPAEKRDLAVKKAEGSILAFIDDDAYPHKDWLEKAVQSFSSAKIAGVCGPGLTPPDDSLLEKVSGWVWKTPLGAGGAGTYRCQAEKECFVDDYPTFNLFIQKKDFLQAGGFDSSFWPGEDTKLCHDLVYKLNKKIVYNPEVIVYHHRRKIFIPHLKQISRYGFQRGYFAKILPKTSKRLGYWIPTVFLLGFILTIIFKFTCPLFFKLGIAVFLFYFLLLCITAVQIFVKTRRWLVAILVIPAIISTHLVYGLMFLKGYIKGLIKSL